MSVSNVSMNKEINFLFQDAVLNDEVQILCIEHTIEAIWKLSLISTN